MSCASLAECGSGCGQVVGGEDESGAGGQVGQGDIHPGLAEPAADGAERAGPVFESDNHDFLLGGDGQAGPGSPIWASAPGWSSSRRVMSMAMAPERTAPA